MPYRSLVPRSLPLFFVIAAGCATDPQPLAMTVLPAAVASTPAPPTSSPKIARIVLGAESACVVRSNGLLYCWGSNRFGQVGDGTTTPRRQPVRIQVPDGAYDVAIADGMACAVTKAATVACWGSRMAPPFRDDREPIPPSETVPTLVPGLADVVSVGVGSTHACALRKDGSVWCWGQSWEGAIGGAPTRGDVVGPRRVEGIPTARGLALAGSSSCAVLFDGTATCWGSNTNYLLGKGEPFSRLPQVIPGLREVERLVIGNHHCALLRDGSIACWGSNQFGEAGSPSTSPGFVAKPTRVAAIDGAVEVAIGGHHTCVRTRDGSVVCWGWTRANRRAADDQGDVSGPPERIEGVRAIEIAAGGMTSCARTGSTDLWCWGGAIGSRLQEDIPLTPKLVTLPDP